MEGIQGATAGPDVGNPPGDAHGSCFDSSLREASGASPLLPSISSCCGFGGANAPPCSSPQAAAWVAMGCGGSGMGASHPSLRTVMPLAPKFSRWRYRGSCKEGSSRAPQEQGGSGEPGQSPRLVGSTAGGAQGSCQRLGGSLARAC